MLQKPGERAGGALGLRAEGSNGVRFLVAELEDVHFFLCADSSGQSEVRRQTWREMLYCYYMCCSLNSSFYLSV